jgi:hypothetical protein
MVFHASKKEEKNTKKISRVADFQDKILIGD